MSKFKEKGGETKHGIHEQAEEQAEVQAKDETLLEKTRIYFCPRCHYQPMEKSEVAILCINCSWHVIPA